MAQNLKTKTARARLAARSSAYWQTLSTGRALGYRKRKADQAGKWLVRVADTQGGYTFQSVATADDVANADGKAVLDYAGALQVALDLTNLDPARITVVAAMDEWTHWKNQTETRRPRQMQNIATARRIASRLPKGATLASLTVPIIDDFIASDTRAGRATNNRLLALLKAGLTRAANRHGYEGQRAWTRAKPHASADAFGARQVVLTEAEENALIDAADPFMAKLLRGMQLTGARTGELTEAICGDLFGHRLTLRHRKGGSPSVRAIDLSPETAEWFRAVVGNRPDSDRLFTQAHGAGWDGGVHNSVFKRAVKATGLTDRNPDSYTFRHGYISRALTRGVPAVAVAQRCGTSVRMLERYYAKFQPADVAGWFA